MSKAERIEKVNRQLGQLDVKRKKQKSLIGWFLSFYTLGLFKMNFPMISGILGHLIL